MQSKLSPGLREQPWGKEAHIRSDWANRFSEPKWSPISKVGQTLRTSEQTLIRLRPGHPPFIDRNWLGPKNSEIISFHDQLIKGLIRMQPCVVKRILRKTPVSRRGLLKHAAKAGARRAKIQYVNTHQPCVYLHDIRAHRCRKAQGEFSQGPLKQRWNDVWSEMPVNYEA